MACNRPPQHQLPQHQTPATAVEGASAKHATSQRRWRAQHSMVTAPATSPRHLPQRPSAAAGRPASSYPNPNTRLCGHAQRVCYRLDHQLADQLVLPKPATGALAEQQREAVGAGGRGAWGGKAWGGGSTHAAGSTRGVASQDENAGLVPSACTSGSRSRTQTVNKGAPVAAGSSCKQRFDACKQRLDARSSSVRRGTHLRSCAPL